MNLLTVSIQKLYWKFLIPLIGSAMVMSVYTLTDAIVETAILILSIFFMLYPLNKRHQLYG